MNIENIVQEIKALVHEEASVWVAYSGGLDSTVLLHLLAGHGAGLNVKAIHVNHQISPNADAWQQQCESAAEQLGISCTCEKVLVKSAGQGLEQAARDERYRVFARYTSPGDVLLTAHHADDQAETLLFRAARGAGLKGLLGIKRQRTLGNATVLRPLLDVAQDSLRQYAHHHALHWVEDESNADEAFDRNFIRRSVLPLLRQRWPQLSTRMSQSVQWLTESDSLLSLYAKEDLQGCFEREERVGYSIDLTVFADFPLIRQKHILRTWCQERGYLLPDAAVLAQADNLLQAKDDACPVLRWGQCELRRYRQRLYLLPYLGKPQAYRMVWSSKEDLLLPDGGLLKNKEGNEAVDLVVASRQGGERCHPQNRQHSQTLKKLLQEYGVEPWLRDRVPLIFSGDDIVAVGDIFVCQINNSRELLGNSFEWSYPRAFEVP